MRVFHKILLLSLVVAVFGELRIIPFQDNFRFAIGSVVFMFVLLYFEELPDIVTGLSTGVTVVAFRVVKDLVLFPGLSLFDALVTHAPSFSFYLVQAVFFRLFKVRQYAEKPLPLGMILIAGDVFANTVEMLFRQGPLVTEAWPYKLGVLLVVAAIRDYLVAGLLSIVALRQLRALREEENKRNERLLMIGTGLYEEAFFLKKSMEHIEKITAQAYQVYRDIKKLDAGRELVRRALWIAEEVHEVKKDLQRTVAGLSKILNWEETGGTMPLSRLVNLVVKSNRKYARSLNKEVEFFTDIRFDFQTGRVYTLLSILNNLVANAIEAIEHHGEIVIYVRGVGDEVRITVADNGEGIKESNLEHIFKPGFTTKYSKLGVAATGIGLTHVKDLVENLGGKIEVESKWLEYTRFKVILPLEQVAGAIK